jgi:OOP family OmpA-OmpF porin
MKKSVASLIMGTALITSVPVMAQGGFIGASIGGSYVEVDAAAFKGSDTAFKIFGGYRFNKNFAIEAFFVDAGEPDDGPLSVDASAFGVSAVGIIPVAAQFELFGKIGLAAWDADFKDPLGTYPDDGSDLTYGIGGAWILNKQVSIRAEWEFIDIEADIGGAVDADTDILSIGVQYNF